MVLFSTEELFSVYFFGKGGGGVGGLMFWFFINHPFMTVVLFPLISTAGP